MIEGRKKIFIFAGVSLLFVIAIVLLLLFLRDKPNGNEPPQTESSVTSTVNGILIDTEMRTFEPPKNNPPPPPPANTEEREKLYVRQLSRTFVERFETFSNQNDNRNIEDATELATANMAGYIATKSKEQTGEYQGVTTKVISMELTAFTTESATVRVGAQVETQTLSAKQTSYKNGRVDLLKVDGVWKVNGVFWDPA